MNNLLELIANFFKKFLVIKKILIMYHYMICCKLKLNLHQNNELHMYWT
jgi:hypothetical protein